MTAARNLQSPTPDCDARTSGAIGFDERSLNVWMPSNLQGIVRRMLVLFGTLITCVAACADDGYQPDVAGAPIHGPDHAPSTSLAVASITRLAWVDGEFSAEPLDTAVLSRLPVGPLRTVGQPLLCVAPIVAHAEAAYNFISFPDGYCGPDLPEQIPTARSRLTRSVCLRAEVGSRAAAEGGYFTVLPFPRYPGHGALQSPQGVDNQIVRESITVGGREYRFSHGAIGVEPDTPRFLYMLIDMPFGPDLRVYGVHMVERDDCGGLVEYPPDP